MTAIELLDKIMEQFQKVSSNSKFSETMMANTKAINVIGDALQSEYKRGFIDGSEKVKNENIKKQIKNN